MFQSVDEKLVTPLVAAAVPAPSSCIGTPRLHQISQIRVNVDAAARRGIPELQHVRVQHHHHVGVVSAQSASVRGENSLEEDASGVQSGDSRELLRRSFLDEFSGKTCDMTSQRMTAEVDVSSGDAVVSHQIDDQIGDYLS